MITRLIYTIPILLFAAACALPPIASTNRVGSSESTTLRPPTGLQIEALPYTFRQPTQFFVDDDILWVAQLNGGENEGKEGVHRIYEEKGAGYVRRRCHGHLGCVRPIPCWPNHSNRRCSHCKGGTAGPRVHVRFCVCVLQMLGVTKGGYRLEGGRCYAAGDGRRRD